MTIPASIENSLHQQGIAYQLVEGATRPMHRLRSTAQLPRHQVAVMVLLGDTVGRQQVLLPSDCMIDITRLCEMQGRNLQALPPEDLRRLAQKYGVDSLAALPILSDVTLVVDERLTQQECVYLEVPGSDCCLALSQPEFAKLVQQGKVMSFTVPLDQLRDQEGDDKAAIQQAVQNFTTLRIKQRLEQTLEMPPLPDTAEKIINLRLNPNAGINDLVKVVERDPSLAAQVVSWASSPYYAAPNGINSVRDAVVRVLGFDLVINLALGLALGRSLEVPKDGVHGVNAYWVQSVYAAALMDGLAKAIDVKHRPQVGLCYLSGLLHNYGYLVLAHVFPPYFEVINRQLEANPHLNHEFVERHVLSITREQISSQLMACWQMPEEVVTALRWQCDSSHEDKHDKYSKLLYLSTQLLRRQGMVDGPAEPIPDALWEELGLTPDKADAALQKVQEGEADLQGIARTLARK
jgi:HD-like signal output (HDOD) protein/prolyl-tRNA editing enzyme YbaK/EbsC (Cys-tRNA(Pro) deacylase)